MNRSHVVDNLAVYDEVKSEEGDQIKQGSVSEKISEYETMFSNIGTTTPLIKQKDKKSFTVMNETEPSEKFTDGDPILWLQTYELIAKVNGWNDEIKSNKLFNYLGGAARIWYMQTVKPDLTVPWSLLRSGLIDKFSNRCNGLMASERISRREQAKSESLETYWFSKIQLINSLAPNMSENEQMAKLVTGMKPSLSNKVIEKFTLEPCRNLDELYKLSKSLNDVLEFMSHDKVKCKKDPEIGSDKIEQINQASDGLRSELIKLAKSNEEMKAIILTHERLERQENNADRYYEGE